MAKQNFLTVRDGAIGSNIIVDRINDRDEWDSWKFLSADGSLLKEMRYL